MSFFQKWQFINELFSNQIKHAYRTVQQNKKIIKKVNSNDQCAKWDPRLEKTCGEEVNLINTRKCQRRHCARSKIAEHARDRHRIGNSVVNYVFEFYFLESMLKKYNLFNSKTNHFLNSPSKINLSLPAHCPRYQASVFVQGR